MPAVLTPVCHHSTHCAQRWLEYGPCAQHLLFSYPLHFHSFFILCPPVHSKNYKKDKRTGTCFCVCARNLCWPISDCWMSRKLFSAPYGRHVVLAQCPVSRDQGRVQSRCDYSNDPTKFEQGQVSHSVSCRESPDQSCPRSIARKWTLSRK